MTSLLLGVKRNQWRTESESLHEDKAYLDARSKAVARDQHICQGCGWAHDKYQEAHHKDDDHTNNHPDNLVTLCTWCHRCHHIGLAGAFDLGFIGISIDPNRPLPSQALINQATRMHDWVKAHPGAGRHYRDWAENFEEYLTACVAAAERVIGSSELRDFADILMNMTDEQYAKRGEIFSTVRLIHPRLSDLNPATKFEDMEITRRQAWISVLKQRLGAPL